MLCAHVHPASSAVSRRLQVTAGIPLNMLQVLNPPGAPKTKTTVQSCICFYVPKGCLQWICFAAKIACGMLAKSQYCGTFVNFSAFEARLLAPQEVAQTCCWCAVRC
jgi:hypothetical protein